MEVILKSMLWITAFSQLSPLGGEQRMKIAPLPPNKIALEAITDFKNM